MILHHDDDGALVDGQVAVTEPIALLAECVEEAVAAPEFAPVPPAQEMTQRTHHLERRVGQACQRRRWRDRAVVVSRGMRRISFRIKACGEAPARLAIASECAGIRDAVRAIDRHMAQVLLPIAGLPILQSGGMVATEGIMCKE